MPLTEAQHRLQNAAHKGMAQQLAILATAPASAPTQGTFRQWAQIALFYAALHHARATLVAHYGSAPTNHRDTLTALYQHTGGRAAPHWSGYVAYKRLFDRSRATRYNAYEPTYLELQRDENDLRTVEQHIL